MDVRPVRTWMHASSRVASLSAQPENGSTPLSEWPEDGQLEDAVRDEVPTVLLSQTVLETPVPFGETIPGESRIHVFARLLDLPAQTGMEGMLDRVPNADYESPFLMSTRVFSTGPLPVRLLETLPVSQNSWTDPDLVRLSQKYRPIRLAAPGKSEIVTPRHHKRTELEMLTL
jgi:hypothetical protein